MEDIFCLLESLINPDPLLLIFIREMTEISSREKSVCYAFIIYFYLLKKILLQDHEILESQAFKMTYLFFTEDVGAINRFSKNKSFRGMILKLTIALKKNRNLWRENWVRSLGIERESSKSFSLIFKIQLAFCFSLNPKRIEGRKKVSIP